MHELIIIKTKVNRPLGQQFHVNLHIENNGVFMGGDKWQNFIRNNDLETGCILHLKYKGNMVFTFRFYDKTSSERASGKKKIIKDYNNLEWDSRAIYFRAYAFLFLCFNLC